ncbi:hypothetical protein ACJJTC_012420 [Scirpophaga incertulas]
MSDSEGNFGVFLEEIRGFLQIHAGGGIRSVSWNFDGVRNYVWADTGDTPLNLMTGTLGLLARTAGRFRPDSIDVMRVGMLRLPGPLFELQYLLATRDITLASRLMASRPGYRSHKSQTIPAKTS